MVGGNDEVIIKSDFVDFTFYGTSKVKLNNGICCYGIIDLESFPCVAIHENGRTAILNNCRTKVLPGVISDNWVNIKIVSRTGFGRTSRTISTSTVDTCFVSVLNAIITRRASRTTTTTIYTCFISILNAVITS